MKREYCTHVFIDLLANVSNWTFVSNWPLRMCTVRAKWDAERENTYGRPNVCGENIPDQALLKMKQNGSEEAIFKINECL